MIQTQNLFLQYTQSISILVWLLLILLMQISKSKVFADSGVFTYRYLQKRRYLQKLQLASIREPLSAKTPLSAKIGRDSLCIIQYWLQQVCYSKRMTTTCQNNVLQSTTYLERQVLCSYHDYSPSYATLNMARGNLKYTNLTSYDA